MAIVAFLLASELGRQNDPSAFSFAIVQDNALTPSGVCLKRARRARWQSVPELDHQCQQKGSPSLPRRQCTPPAGTLFEGNSAVTSPNTRNGSNRAPTKRQSSLPRVPRRNKTTSGKITKQLPSNSGRSRTSSRTRKSDEETSKIIKKLREKSTHQ